MIPPDPIGVRRKLLCIVAEGNLLDALSDDVGRVSTQAEPLGRQASQVSTA